MKERRCPIGLSMLNSPYRNDEGPGFDHHNKNVCGPSRLLQEGRLVVEGTEFRNTGLTDQVGNRKRWALVRIRMYERKLFEELWTMNN